MKISQKRLAAEQELRERIANGYYKIGEMLPSEPNLAKEFHIARETLRSICSQLIDEKLLVKIPRQGTYVKTGASRLGHKIFYLLPHENFLSDVRLEYDFGAHDMLTGILDAAFRNDALVVTLPVTHSQDAITSCPSEIRAISQGSIVICNSLWYAPLFPFLKQINCKIGFFYDSSRASDREAVEAWPYCARSTVNWRPVFSDTVSQLYNTGCRKIALMGYNIYDPQATHVCGYLEGITRHGLPDLRCNFASAGGDFKQMQDFCRENADNLDALIVRLPLHTFRLGRKNSTNINAFLGIPEHIKIVSVFPSHFMSSFEQPTLYLQQPIQQIGSDLAESLLKSIPETRSYNAKLALYNGKSFSDRNNITYIKDQEK